MEDKVFLDEAGLGEVGKVISKFYASKEDTENLSKNLTQLQDNIVFQQFTGSRIRFNDTVLSGEYFIRPYGVDDFPIYELLRTHSCVSQSFLGLLLVYREPESAYALNSPCKIVQKMFDFNNRTFFVRKTSEFKREYNNGKMLYDYSFDRDEFHNQCQQIQWEDWAESIYESQPFSLASLNRAGFMSPEDKKKLDSIDIEKYAQQEKDIKSMKEEIALLKSQIEKLQASINNKE